MASPFVVDLAVVVASALTILVVGWRPVARRLGAATVAVAWLALVVEFLGVGSWRSIALAQAVGISAFWLVDRGIPGNRPRPGWLWVLGGVVVILAIASALVPD